MKAIALTFASVLLCNLGYAADPFTQGDRVLTTDKTKQAPVVMRVDPEDETNRTFVTLDSATIAQAKTAATLKKTDPARASFERSVVASFEEATPLREVDSRAACGRPQVSSTRACYGVYYGGYYVYYYYRPLQVVGWFVWNGWLYYVWG